MITQHGSGASVTAAMRARMVQRLAAAGITSPAVLQAMSVVERHRFIDSALASRAYENTSLPIGLEQTISQPYIVARMVELLLGAQCVQSGGHLGAHLGRVLEIGTGCGYQAAVLAHMAREVYSIERLHALHAKAHNNLYPLDLPHLHLLVADGMQGHAAAAPYEGIICAAGGLGVPQQWCDQLATGGRLVAPVEMETTEGSRQQALVVVDKTPQGLRHSVLEAVHFVPLKPGIS